MGLWVVPQVGKRAIALGWQQMRLNELDLEEYLSGGRLNIAVALNQSGVIDVECDSQAAEDRLQELLSFEVPVTPTWKSRRGLHRLFLRPDDVPGKAKIEVDGIEFRLGAGGKGALSTVPPSISPDDGTVYRWLPGLSIHEVSPAPLPESLVELLRKSARSRSKKNTIEFDRDESGEIGEGRRNDELFRAGCRAARTMEEAGVLALLTGMNALHCRPPLPDAEVQAIVNSALERKVRGEKEITALPCSSWNELIEAWTDATEWRKSIQDILACMLAVACSTSQTGNQLFLMVVGEPGSLKTVLCDALLVSPSCKRVERLNNIFSGVLDWEDKERDFSFISRANHKTWITPEADLLMSSPGYAQVMSQMRRAFDGSTSITHGNRDFDMDYAGLRTPWIKAGTPAMLDRRHASLGDRFLRIRMDQPTEEIKQKILRKVGLTELDAMCQESNCSPNSTLPPKLLRAYRLTGGYVDWLRANATRRIREVRARSDEDVLLRRCAALADWAANARSAPPDLLYGREPDYAAIKELPSRLKAQFVRMSVCLTVVLGKEQTDDEVLALTRRVALDTGDGRTQVLIRKLGDARRTYPTGVIPDSLAIWTREDPVKVARWLAHMEKVGAVRCRKDDRQQRRWLLTDRLQQLYQEVCYAQPG